MKNVCLVGKLSVEVYNSLLIMTSFFTLHTSDFLFGRARIILLAELASFQYLLQRKSRTNKKPFLDSQNFLYRTLYRISYHWSLGSIIFFVLSLIFFVLWTLMEVFSNKLTEVDVQDFWSLAGSILVNLFMLLVIPIICLVDKKEKTKSNQGEDGFMQRLISLHTLIVEYLMTRLSGESDEMMVINENRNDSLCGEKTYQLQANFEEALNVCKKKTTSEIERIIKTNSATLENDIQAMLKDELENQNKINRVELERIHQKMKESEVKIRLELMYLNHRISSIDKCMAAEFREHD